MTKVEEKKRVKREALFGAAFTLFTTQGIHGTSISDIVNKAQMAKGTFYLYFKDKFDLRDKLIVAKSSALLSMALEHVDKKEDMSLEDIIIKIADTIIDYLDNEKTLFRFIAKNLNMGIVKEMVITDEDDDKKVPFYNGYLQFIRESGRDFHDPDLMLYMIMELISGSCYQVILYGEPVTLEVLKPCLYDTIRAIIKNQEAG